MFAHTVYRSVMKQYANAMGRLGGSSEYYAACDTLQFDDYSKFAAGSFNEAHKRKVRENTFPGIYKLLMTLVPKWQHLVHRIINNCHIHLPDFPPTALDFLAVATATPSKICLVSEKSFYVNIAETYYSLY